MARTRVVQVRTPGASGTRIDEIAPDIYRISTPVPPEVVPGGFTFNQYLIRDDAPLLFHTGLRGLFPVVREAIASVLPVERLRYLAFAHFEADECGAMNDFLAVAPGAEPVCSAIGAQITMADCADRPPRPLTDGAELTLGARTVRWLDAPHVPHGWDGGFLFETTTRTLLCGDLFTQAGDRHPALTEADILEPSEAMRGQLDYFAHHPGTGAVLEKLARTGATTLACMHGPAWRGDAPALLRELARRLR